MLLCCTTVSGKDEGWYQLKRVNPLYVCAPVLSQELDVQWLSFVNVVHKCFSLFVFYIDLTVGFPV